MTANRLLFVTGKLAEPALREILPGLAHTAGFAYEVAVLPITVAALMHVRWVARKLTIPPDIARVIMPGWCQGDLNVLSEQFQVPFERGPKDVRDLPEYFGKRGPNLPPLDDYTVQILAEINHAPLLSDTELMNLAEQYRDSGADVIDLGCIPGERWPQIGLTVKQLVTAGFRVSVDSFDQQEVTDAVTAGADLILSAQSSNLNWVKELPAEIVAIPDTPDDQRSLERTAAELTAAGRTIRWDPILEPIGFGFAHSLGRYYATRTAQPNAELMMGIGNVTELSEVDSAGMNFLFAAICEELRIGSVLTTQVINWCRTAVREFDAARRLVRYSLKQRRLPKHLDGRLLLLRDARLKSMGATGLETLHQQITDPNFRIFAERGEVHLMNRDGYWHGPDPYEVFDRMLASVGSLTAEHAFYLGMELMKARTAITLGKNYIQDEALRWGFLTVEQLSALERRKSHRHSPAETEDDAPASLKTS